MLLLLFNAYILNLEGKSLRCALSFLVCLACFQFSLDLHSPGTSLGISLDSTKVVLLTALACTCKCTHAHRYSHVLLQEKKYFSG